MNSIKPTENKEFTQEQALRACLRRAGTRKGSAVKSRIRVVVVDDMKVERLVLKNLIRTHEDFDVVGEAGSALDAVKIIQREKPDVIFLDVHMPEANGFQLVEWLPSKPQIVFVSASSRYAVQAFGVEAVDYLLKPVSPLRFAATVERLRRAVLSPHAGVLPLEDHDRICLRTTERTHIVPIHSIVALEADGDFTRTIISDDPQPILACKRLGDLEAMLPGGGFLRLDRSLIVNLRWIMRLERVSRNEAHLWMKGLRRPLHLGRTAAERLRGEMKLAAA